MATRKRINEDEINEGDNTGVRTTGRIKKPKAVFDPSDNYLSRAQRQSANAAANASPSSVSSVEQRSGTLSRSKRNSVSSNNSPGASNSAQQIETVNFCYICKKRGTGIKNKLFDCVSCDNKVHKNCIKVDTENILTVLSNYKCADCSRLCGMCFEPLVSTDKIENDDEFIICTVCEKPFHFDCLNTPLLEPEEIPSWKCIMCSEDNENICLDSKIPTKEILKIIGEDPNSTKEQKQSNKQSAVVATDVVSDIKNDAENNAVSRSPKIRKNQTDDKTKEIYATGAKALQQAVKVGNAGAFLPDDDTDSDVSSLPLGLSKSQTDGKAEKGAGNGVVSTAVTSKRTVNARKAAASAKGEAMVVACESDSESINSLVIPSPSKRQKLDDDKSTETSDISGISTSISASHMEHYNPMEPIDIPNVKGWDVDKVVDYLTNYFPNEAQIFKEQEIDGTSLLLLKRSDIINKLPIKLGPSLRLYSLILKIQSQRDDPTLGWNCES